MAQSEALTPPVADGDEVVEAVQQFARTLRRLAASGATSGSVPPLCCALLHPAAPSAAQIESLFALCTLARAHARSRARLELDEKGVKAIVQIVKDGMAASADAGPAGLLETAAELLALLAGGPQASNRESQRLIRDSGGIAPLVQIVADNSATAPPSVLSPVVPCALRAIANLARQCADNQRAIRDEGGIPPLVSLLDADSSLTALAAAALAELALDKECCDLIFEAHGLTKLVRLLRDTTPEVAAEAAHTLKSVAFRSAVDRDTIRDEGGVPPLVALLSRGGSSSVEASWAAGALRHMAYTNTANCEAIRQAGAIPALTRLITDGASKAEDDAAGALWNLTEHCPLNCLALLEAGGVPPLVGVLARDVSLFAGEPARDVTPEPLWRLAENALINLIEKSGAHPTLAAATAAAAAATAAGANHAATVAAARGAAVGPASIRAAAAAAAAAAAMANAAGAGTRVGATEAEAASERAAASAAGAAAETAIAPTAAGGASSSHQHLSLFAGSGLGGQGGARMGGGRRATSEILQTASQLGLLRQGSAPRLPAILLRALQRQIEPALDAAQEGTDEVGLRAAIEDASSLGLEASRLEEARVRFRETAVAVERRARRERLGVKSVNPPDEFRCPLTLTTMRDPGA